MACKVEINRGNVGRIAERIVANELESRGFRISDLNKEGTSANADLLAVKDGKALQLQVKGSTDDGFWVSHGFATQEKIDGHKPMYNSADSFYRANFVILVCVKAASQYRCVVLPAELAEALAQLCVEYSYRLPNRDGSKKKPGKTVVSPDYVPNSKNSDRLRMMQAEHIILQPYIDRWEILEGDCQVDEVKFLIKKVNMQRLLRNDQTLEEPSVS